MVWQTGGCQLSFSDSIDIPVDASPENVKDGKTRTADGELNAWVSDRRQGLPQSITLKQSISLKLKAEKEISNVQITADVDLAYPMYAFRYVPPADRTVKGLTVSVHNADGWHTVGKITDNFRRLIRVKFPPVKADEVKITVTDTLGVNYAKIYEVRIYK